MARRGGSHSTRVARVGHARASPIASIEAAPRSPTRSSPFRSTSRFTPTCVRVSRWTDRHLHFSGIDLVSDGAQSQLTGTIDFAHWPEQTLSDYVEHRFPDAEEHLFSSVHLRRRPVRDRFQGTFHLFSGGRELKGTFDSPMAGVNAWRFPNLHGSVLCGSPIAWRSPTRRVGSMAASARFDYKLAAAQRARRADPRDVGCHVSRRRSATAHRFSRDAGTSAWWSH